VPAIDRDGAHVHYEVTGEGPPLLLGHSLLCDGRMWENVAPALARRFRLHNIDARGHGRSTWTQPFTLEDLAEDWIAVMDHEKIERALLCGLSMGGMTAMRLALAHPGRVAALALLDTSADAAPTVERVLYLMLAELQRATGIIRPYAPLIARKMFGTTSRRDRPDVVSRGMARILDRDMRGFYPAYQAVFRRNSIHGRLGELRCPTLVLVGEEDIATPPRDAERIVRAVSGAELVRIPGAGHLTPLEAPAAVEQALSAFLDRHAGAARVAA
jgi:pimeloyl-ACP methyl ester carboxylesterase